MVRWSLYGFSTSSRWGGGGGIRLDPERILPSRAAFVSKAIAMHGAQFFLLTLRSCDIFLRQTCACEWVQMRTCRQPTVSSSEKVALASYTSGSGVVDADTRRCRCCHPALRTHGVPTVVRPRSTLVVAGFACT
ncbi:unnamed protein product [Ectocarpus sp. 12 AP-2014]